MNSLFIASHEFPPLHGGIATVTVEIAQALHQLGTPLHLLVPRGSTLPPTFALDPKVQFKLEPLPIAANHGLGACWRMAKTLKQYENELKKSVLLITEPGPIRALYLAARFLNFTPGRLWLVVHGSEILRGLHSPLWGVPLRHALQKAEKIATVSHFNANLLVEQFGLERNVVRILPLAAPSALRRMASELGLNSNQTKDRLRLLTVARLHPRKGQDIVLKALAKLPKNILAGIEYDIVGTGRNSRYQRYLQKTVRRHKLPVIFSGAVDSQSLPQHYAAADIFILTSRQHRCSIEGFGLVYLEANCFGLPSIGTETGGTADAILHQTTGLLLNNSSSVNVADAIQKLATDSDLRNRLADAAKQRALARTWKSVATTLLDSPSMGDCFIERFCP